MIPLNPAKIPDMFKEARVLEQAGKLDEARKRYEAVLSVDAKSAPAHFQIGQIYARQRAYKQALNYVGRALNLKPDENAIWNLYAKIVAETKDPQLAQEFIANLKKAPVSEDFRQRYFARFGGTGQGPADSMDGVPARELKQAIGLLKAGKAADAAKLAGHLRIQFPKSGVVADILASSMAATGRPQEAERNYRAALELDPKSADVRSNYGRFLSEHRRFGEAVAMLSEAIRLAPESLHAHLNMARALLGAGNKRAAQDCLNRGLELEPKAAILRFELGQLLLGENQFSEAVSQFEQALENGGDPTITRIWIARAVSGMGRDYEALELLDKVAETAPDNAEVLLTKAGILQLAGKFEEASEILRRTIALSPNNGRLYRLLAAGETLSLKDPVVYQMEAKLNDSSVHPVARAEIGFAMAKVQEDNEQYDQVFNYLRPASELIKKSYAYDFDAEKAQLDQLADALSAGDYAGSGTEEGRSRIAPIFVTGLPRSGTTLVEQILASHSQVTGGGELGYAGKVVNRAVAAADGSLVKWSDIPAEKIAEMSQEMEERYTAQVGDAEYFTDKSVHSYRWFGPIRACLPNARLVVVKRDPRDMLLSMYKNMFTPGDHIYSYDLRDLARIYAVFESFVALWQEKLPGQVHVIEYEALVDDLEGETRKLVDACGLIWDDGCLEFHKNERRVDTLSVHQVRQPIYSSSKASWKKYASELGDLFDELGGEYAASAS